MSLLIMAYLIFFVCMRDVGSSCTFKFPDHTFSSFKSLATFAHAIHRILGVRNSKILYNWLIWRGF